MRSYSIVKLWPAKATLKEREAPDSQLNRAFLRGIQYVFSVGIEVRDRAFYRRSRTPSSNLADALSESTQVVPVA